MSEGVELNLGSGGDTIAADDIDGHKFQRIKLIHGADGVNIGDVSATNPFPIDIVFVGGATEDMATQTTLAAVASSVAAIDAGQLAAGHTVVIASGTISLPADAATQTTLATLLTSAKFDTVFGTSAWTLGTGVRDATTQRVTIATNDLVPISVASLPLPSGAATAANITNVFGSSAWTLGTGVRDATTQRVTIATNDSVPVTGTVTVDAGTDTSTAALLTSAKFDTVFGTSAWTLGTGVRDATTQRVTIATNDSVPVTGTVIVDAGTDTSTAALLTSAKFDTVFGTSAWTLGTGVRDATTQRVTIATNDVVPISAASLPLPSGAATALNITDVFGSTTWTLGTGTRDAATQRVTIATNDVVPVSYSTGTFIVDGSAVDHPVEGVDVHGLTATGQPLPGGAEARTTLPAAVDSADAVRLIADDYGRQIMLPQAPRDLVTKARLILSADETETNLLGQVASVFHDLSSITLSNSGSTASTVTIRDDTGGTPVLEFHLAASGGGAVVNFPVPLPQGFVNDNWTAQCAGSTTSVHISAVFINNR